MCLKRGLSQVGVAEIHLKNTSVFLFRALTTPLVLVGFLSYAIGSLLWLIVISRVELSFAYPLISIGYVLVAIFSWWLFKENITWIRWLGTVVIILGVILVSRG